jgi:hypothetical protein
MVLIRWWRVRRAYALLRFCLRVSRGTPKRALVGLTVLTIEMNEFAGKEAPPELISALAVIKTAGVAKPTW